jgi:hypothetical protein
MKILTLGCSYTSWKWPTWPDYLRQLTGADVVNLGQKGDSNFIISHKLNYALKNYSWDLVIAMWTGSARESILVDSTNIEAVGRLKNNCDVDIFDKIYANKLGDQMYVNINEVAFDQELLKFFPGHGRLDDHVKSDYNVLLGESMLRLSGLRHYNMFYFDHETRLSALRQHLGHIGNFESFDWLAQWPTCFPWDKEKIGRIDNHPLPLRHFELAENICNTLKLDKQDYTLTLQQAQTLTAKIQTAMAFLESQVSDSNLLELRLKFNGLVAKMPNCRDHKQFIFK